MTKKIASTERSTTAAVAASAPGVAGVAALTLPAVMLAALNMQQHSAQAFQAPCGLFLSQARTATGRSSRSSPIIMRYQSPWDLEANSGSRKQQGDGSRGPGFTIGPMTFSLPGLIQYDPLLVGDPEVSETDTGYTLTFNLPTDVKEDGLDVSVSGRLLTIEARVTREDKSSGDDEGAHAAAAAAARGGWFTRSSRTHSAARSFVLPKGVSNQVTASWVSAGKVEIKLDKVAPGAEDTAAPVANGPTAMEDSGGVSVAAKDETSIPSSPADEYLAGLHTQPTPGSSHPDVGSSADAAPSASFDAEPEHRHRRRSMLAALDEEFSDLAKAMWCDGSLRFPTEEQVAATVEKAREERAKRVTAMRRATMAAHVSETDVSYVVKVSLPEGAKRDDVNLALTPDNALRVSFSAEGHRPISKEVRLPWDAVLSNISATFQAEKNDGSQEEGGEAPAAGSVSGGGVCSLEITVERAAPPQPKTIDIN